MRALGELDLVLERLRREARDDRTESTELVGVVAERARLGCAAARAGKLVPAGERFDAGLSRARVDVEHSELGAELGEVDRSLRRVEHERRDAGAREVIGGAVILRLGQVRREHVWIVALHASNHRR